MTKKTIEMLNQHYTDERLQQHLLQSEMTIQLLEYCSYRPGAKIQITVTHDDGQVATADLYDHAALVQSLIDALRDFQSEL